MKLSAALKRLALPPLAVALSLTGCAGGVTPSGEATPRPDDISAETWRGVAAEIEMVEVQGLSMPNTLTVLESCVQLRAANFAVLED